MELRSWTNDELGTILTSQMPIDSLITVVKTIDIHPPTHYLLVHYWMTLFGNSLASMRFLNIIPIFLLIPFVYAFANRFFPKGTAIFAIPLIVVSPNLIYYSRMVRYYSWSVLFAFLSIASFLWLLETKKRINKLIFIAATVVLGYLQYLTIAIVLICENVFFALSYKKPFSRKITYQWFLMQTAVVMLIIPVILFYTLPQITHMFSSKVITNTPYPNINLLGMFSSIGYSFYAMLFSQNFFPWEFIYIIPVLVIFLILFVITYHFLKNNTYQFYFFIAFIIMPIFLVSFAMYVTRMNTAITHSVAYSLFILPFLLTTISASISTIKVKPLRYTLFIALICFNVLSIKNYFEYHTALCWDPNWKEVADYIDTNSLPADVIIANNPEHAIIKTSYISHYLHRETIDVQQSTPNITGNWKFSSGYENFKHVFETQNPERIWVVVRNRVPGEAIFVERYLEEKGYVKMRTKGFWKNDEAARRFKNALARLAFLNFKAVDVGQYMISVSFYQAPRSAEFRKGERDT